MLTNIISLRLSRIFTAFVFVCFFQVATALPLKLTIKDCKNPPPRIIRTCCAFGTDLHVLAIQKIKINDVTSVEKIGSHTYLGSANEGNGILYTKRGGFIDLGHLRDQADWTAYLNSIILLNKSKGQMKLNLGIEGGKKSIDIKWETDIDSIDIIRLAGKIAYDLSVWHEISTWFGASYVPFVPERYSSFSVEDIYSNLLGVTLGIEALKSNLPFEEAMTILLNARIAELEAVNTEKETLEALEATKNIWWTNEKSLPSKNILLKHQCEAYPGASPWLIPSNNDSARPYYLNLETLASNGQKLNDFYEFQIKLNLKLAEKKTMKAYNKKILTQNDFVPLLKSIELEMQKEFDGAAQLNR